MLQNRVLTVHRTLIAFGYMYLKQWNDALLKSFMSAPIITPCAKSNLAWFTCITFSSSVPKKALFDEGRFCSVF